MITEDYVPFDIAKLLKDKGFNGQYHMYYVEDGKYTCDDLHDIKDYARSVAQFDYLHKTKVPAPTLQMAMKWLREVHNIDIFPWKIGKGIYSVAIFDSNTGQDLSSDKDFPSEKYEQACNIAIRYCLENLI